MSWLIKGSMIRDGNNISASAGEEAHFSTARLPVDSVLRANFSPNFGWRIRFQPICSGSYATGIGAFPKTQKHKLCPSSIADVAFATSRRHHQSVSPGAKCVLRRLQHANDDYLLSAAFRPNSGSRKKPKKDNESDKTMKATEIQPVAS